MSTNVDTPLTVQGNSAPAASENTFAPLSILAVSEIDDSGRLRPVDAVAAQGIAASMARDGLLNPIDVCQLPGKKGFRLVAGGHRLAAARMLGWTEIPAFIRSANALDRKAREIAENFYKADMSPIDQARFIAELIETEKARLGIAPEKDGRQDNKRGGKVDKKQLSDDLCTLHKSIGLQEAVATRLGLNQSSVSRHLALNGIAASLLERVRVLPIGDNASALRKLAGLDVKKQERVVSLLEEGAAKTVPAALGIIEKKPPVDAAKKRLSAFTDAYSRMSKREQRDALRVLSRMLPAGVIEIVFDDEVKVAAE